MATLNDTVKAKDGEISKMREQMLDRTKELRTIIGVKDSLGNDVQAITDRALKFGLPEHLISDSSIRILVISFISFD